MLSFKSKPRENSEKKHLPCLIKTAIRNQDLDDIIKNSLLHRKEKYYCILAIFFCIIFKKNTREFPDRESLCVFIDESFRNYQLFSDSSFEKRVVDYIYKHRKDWVFKKTLTHNWFFSIAQTCMRWINTLSKAKRENKQVDDILNNMWRHHTDAVGENVWSIGQQISNIFWSPTKSQNSLKQAPKVWCPLRLWWIAGKVYDIIEDDALHF